MLVYLHEYRTGDAGSDRTETSEALARDTSSYFDVEELSLDERELLEVDGQDLQRRDRVRRRRGDRRGARPRSVTRRHTPPACDAGAS